MNEGENFGVKSIEDIGAQNDSITDINEIEVKNPRIDKVLRLQEDAERQSQLERQRSRRMEQEQLYLNKMSASVEEHLRNTKEGKKYNEEFEESIRREVYRMHGISEDKLQGMNEYRRAWYQGAAFALFFLSMVLVILCGVLHGFGSELCMFMAFYTAIEGALLANGRKQSKVLGAAVKSLYLLLFPVMMAVFVCYELEFEIYGSLVPFFGVAGLVILVLGSVSYFTYDPYRMDRRNRRRANDYLKEMEKAALKEVRLKEKALQKLEIKKEKEAVRGNKRQEKDKIREEKKEKRSVWWQTTKQKWKSGFQKKHHETEDTSYSETVVDSVSTERNKEQDSREKPGDNRMAKAAEHEAETANRQEEELSEGKEKNQEELPEGEEKNQEELSEDFIGSEKVLE